MATPGQPTARLEPKQPDRRDWPTGHIAVTRASRRTDSHAIPYTLRRRRRSCHGNNGGPHHDNPRRRSTRRGRLRRTDEPERSRSPVRRTTLVDDRVVPLRRSLPRYRICRDVRQRTYHRARARRRGGRGHMLALAGCPAPDARAGWLVVRFVHVDRRRSDRPQAVRHLRTRPVKFVTDDIVVSESEMSSGLPLLEAYRRYRKRRAGC